jgi:hypothetical protein
MQRERKSGIRHKVWLTIGMKLLLSLPILAEVDPKNDIAITHDNQGLGEAKATDNCTDTPDVYKSSNLKKFAAQSCSVDNVAMTIAPEPATLAILGLGLLMFRRNK